MVEPLPVCAFPLNTLNIFYVLVDDGVPLKENLFADFRVKVIPFREPVVIVSVIYSTLCSIGASRLL